MPRRPQKPYKRINIEISNVCNLSCDFCPPVEREQKRMGLDLFGTVLSQAVPLTEYVCLHLMGDPFTHPHLAEILDQCKAQGASLDLTTNGTLMGPSNRTLALHPSVKKLNISVQSFEANFPDQPVDGYFRNLLQLFEEARQTRPELPITLRLWDLEYKSPSETETNVKMRRKIEETFGVSFETLLPELNRRHSILLRDRLFVSLDRRFQWPSLKLPLRSTRGTCQGLRNHFGVLADGSVVPCCLDKEGVIRLGNIASQSIPEILDSFQARQLRIGFQQRKLIHPLCQRCDFIEVFA